jgi:hypothetical protein
MCYIIFLIAEIEFYFRTEKELTTFEITVDFRYKYRGQKIGVYIGGKF